MNAVVNVPGRNAQDPPEDFDQKAPGVQRQAAFMRLLDRNLSLNRQSSERTTEQTQAYSARSSVSLNSTSAPIVDLPELPVAATPRRKTFQKLQEWEGYVVSIGANEFRARLIDLTRGSDVAEEEGA